MSLPWEERHEPDPRFFTETNLWHFHRKLVISRLHNFLCFYSYRCRKSPTELAAKLRGCRCFTDTVAGTTGYTPHRCRRSRLCPFCLFIDRAVPLYMEMLRKSDPALRFYHLRFRSGCPADSFEAVADGVKQLTAVRNRLQDTQAVRKCIRRWSGLSLTGTKAPRLRMALDLLCLSEKGALPKFEQLAGQFPKNRCTLFYCVSATKMNIQQRLGTFLQYPAWFVTTPFTEIEYYLQTDFFKTRLSSYS
jgi:hypothetical protein